LESYKTDESLLHETTIAAAAITVVAKKLIFIFMMSYCEVLFFNLFLKGATNLY
jgi:hypothetical protein